MMNRRNPATSNENDGPTTNCDDPSLHSSSSSSSSSASSFDDIEDNILTSEYEDHPRKTKVTTASRRRKGTKKYEKKSGLVFWTTFRKIQIFLMICFLLTSSTLVSIKRQRNPVFRNEGHQIVRINNSKKNKKSTSSSSYVTDTTNNYQPPPPPQQQQQQQLTVIEKTLPEDDADADTDTENYNNSAFTEEEKKDSICYVERYTHLQDRFCKRNADINNCDIGGILNHYQENKSKNNGLLWGCLSKKDAVCYSKRYPNLYQSYCNGNLPNMKKDEDEDEQKCDIFNLYLHYHRAGKRQGLLFGCTPATTTTTTTQANHEQPPQRQEEQQEDSNYTKTENAICYAKRYSHLYTEFCNNKESNCVYEQLNNHYQKNGKQVGLLWGCDYNDDALCYAKRYNHLYDGFCTNEDRNNKDDKNPCDILGLYNHYDKIGKEKGLIWECGEDE